MEKTKIIIALTAIIALVTVTIGFTFAQNIGGNEHGYGNHMGFGFGGCN